MKPYFDEDGITVYHCDARDLVGQLHAEIVDRDVHGDVVVDHERLTGFSDGRSAEATVTYHVRNGAITTAVY